MPHPTMLPATADAAGLPLWLMAPFVLLLLLIAAMPLTPPRLKHWWEHNYPLVAIGLGLAVAGYYLWRVPSGGAALGHALHEYFSFIALIGSLFVVAGGIHLKVVGETTPWKNAVFLAVGAVVANLIGTTGASMVFIRPWIRMNKIRIGTYHIVFFIFIVSNCGGALTPIGDPPLFLGYLRGVPFFWLIGRVWPAWAFTIAALLAIFYVFDRRGFRRMPEPLQAGVRKTHDTFRLDGKRNLALLLVVVGAVFLPETYFVRELAMLAAAAVSYFFTPKAVHVENHFHFGPIKEVAFLFLGIFTTMMPALNYLEQHGHEFGLSRPGQYYFTGGALSAALDNAPTYVNFLRLAEATFVEATPAEQADTGGGSYDRRAVHILLETHPAIVLAISLGAVFFGAMTYLGNGPNFMVKSIAHDAGVRTPSFFGYILKYSLPILLPILALVGWLFL
ncbi:MAG TPA: sodium:proton antiporter [Opitutaceae bacterium]|jgi:Na+/H+ antiporter NhaD/arsenite permease-like protein|nr:sodium:proton antiporter [Opitutaceae bacterium]